MVCAVLAAGTHALLLFAVHPGTSARPLPPADQPAAVEVSIIEAAPAAPEIVATPPAPLPPDPPPPPPDPAPVVPEPMIEPPPALVPEPKPERAERKADPPPRPRAEAPKPRAPVPARSASTPSARSSGNTEGAAPAVASSRGPTTGARPRYRSNPKPDYPPESRRLGHEGVVILAVAVTAEGRAASVQLQRSSGFPLLDTAAQQAVRRWTFDPARAAGLPVAARVEVPVRFDLSR